MPAPSPSNIRPGRGRRPPRCRTSCPRRSNPSGFTACRPQSTVIRPRFNAQCVGRTFDVLFEKPGRHPGQIVGRSPYLQPVVVMAPATLIGEVAAVTITGIRANSLLGALATARAERMRAAPMLAEG